MNQKRQAADVVVVPVWHETKGAQIAFKQDEFDAVVDFPLKNGDFLGKEGETLLLYRPDGKEKRVLLLGLGNRGSCLPDTLRRAYGSAVKALRAKKLHHANFLFPENELIGRDILCRAVMEGTLLANYSFDSLKNETLKNSPVGHLEKICFCGLKKEDEALFKKTQILVDATNYVRDLVNANADDINVPGMCHAALQLGKEISRLKVTVLDKKHLEKEKMGLLLAVGRGASSGPALVLVEYRGDPRSKELTAIVGKGIVFDTGGLNLKPTGGIETMKCDMAGSAAVLGVLQAAAELKIKKNIIGVLALAENAIGPNSYKPGDVYRSYSGKMVEIANTDAEGRLVLADAIAYVQEKHAPTQIIDLATLTGGIVVALGEEATGLFSNDDTLAHALERAGERTHERLWRMPIYPEYKDLLKSSLADIKNSGPRKASSGSAAVFLQQFVKEIPWAHLDIAGTAYLSELKPYQPTFATGVGVRLLIDFLEHVHAKQK